MLTERTLRRWRKEALLNIREMPGSMSAKQSERILRMTQELLDQHLLRKE